MWCWKTAYRALAMDGRQAIKQPERLTELLVALGIVIVLFFVHHHLGFRPAYVAFIGVAIALPLICPHPEELFGHVEWSVLVVFAAFFSFFRGQDCPRLTPENGWGGDGSVVQPPFAGSRAW